MLGSTAIATITKAIGGLLSDYAKEIEVGMADDGTLAISVPIKVKQAGPVVDVEVGISFVKEKIKDAVTFQVDGQRELFGPDGTSVEITNYT